MLTPSEYRDIVAKKGHALKTIGINAVALAREDALRALAALDDSQMAVLGGDVYWMEESTIKPTRDSWYINRDEAISLQEYLQRTREAARCFLETYPDPKASSKLRALGANGVYIEKYASGRTLSSSMLFSFVLSELGV